jgi:hypothetical protein
MRGVLLCMHLERSRRHLKGRRNELCASSGVSRSIVQRRLDYRRLRWKKKTAGGDIDYAGPASIDTQARWWFDDDIALILIGYVAVLT